MYIFSITGFVSDGEFIFLRAKGYTRPLSVLQVHSNVRNLYSRMSLRKMLGKITPKGKPYGHTYCTFCMWHCPTHWLCIIINFKELFYKAAVNP